MNVFQYDTIHAELHTEQHVEIIDGWNKQYIPEPYKVYKWRTVNKNN